jgi:hypothetical protein
MDGGARRGGSSGRELQLSGEPGERQGHIPQSQATCRVIATEGGYLNQRLSAAGGARDQRQARKANDSRARRACATRRPRKREQGKRCDARGDAKRSLQLMGQSRARAGLSMAAIADHAMMLISACSVSIGRKS